MQKKVPNNVIKNIIIPLIPDVLSISKYPQRNGNRMIKNIIATAANFLVFII
ncbi:MAG: hypothetical protein ACK4ON_11830 [Bacteroidia bacterium]